MHYGTFRLSHEPMDEPLQLLEKEAKAAGIEDRVFVLEEGVTRFFLVGQQNSQVAQIIPRGFGGDGITQGLKKTGRH